MSIFTVEKAALEGIRQEIKDYNTRNKERVAQAKRNQVELNRLNRKYLSLCAEINRLQNKRKPSDADQSTIVRKQKELGELAKQTQNLAAKASLTGAKELKVIAPVWVPVGNTKVLMDWKAIEPLNRLLNKFQVALLTDSTQSKLEVRYFALRTKNGTTRYELKGSYSLYSLLSTSYIAFGQHAPTCSVSELVETRVL